MVCINTKYLKEVESFFGRMKSACHSEGVADWRNATVKIHRVNLGETPEAILTPDRNGKYFSKNIEVDNSSSAIEELLDVYCHKLLDGQEIVAKESGAAFVPKNPEEFLHDADGNLLRDGKFTYTWDGENRLISAESSTGVSPVKIEFKYDYLNRRVEKKVYNWQNDDWNLTSDVKLVWDGMNCIAEFDAASNTLLKSYLWGLDISGSLQASGGVGGLVRARAGPDTYFPVYDGNGNVVSYLKPNTDNLTLSSVAEFEYSPSPNIIVKSGPKADELAEVASFSTKPYCKELDAFLYPFRILKDGRWTSRDPLEETGGNENPYRITSNDTINKYDVLGMWGEDIHYTATKRWAKQCSYPEDAAEAIGNYDNGVDSGDTSPLKGEGQKYHFDRPFGGPDSRLELYSDTNLTSKIE